MSELLIQMIVAIVFALVTGLLVILAALWATRR